MIDQYFVRHALENLLSSKVGLLNVLRYPNWWSRDSEQRIVLLRQLEKYAVCCAAQRGKGQLLQPSSLC
jgi:hypothetical protein